MRMFAVIRYMAYIACVKISETDSWSTGRGWA